MKGFFIAIAVLAAAGHVVGEQRALRRDSGELNPSAESDSGPAQMVAQRLRSDAQPQPTGSAAEVAGTAVADAGDDSEFGPLPSAEEVRAQAPKDDYVSKSEMKEWRRRRIEALKRSIEMADAAIERAQGAKRTAEEAIKSADGNAKIVRREREAIKSANKAIERAEYVKKQAHVRELVLQRRAGKSAAKAETEQEKWARLHSEEESALPQPPTGAAGPKAARKADFKTAPKAGPKVAAKAAQKASSADVETVEEAEEVAHATGATGSECDGTSPACVTKVLSTLQKRGALTTPPGAGADLAESVRGALAENREEQAEEEDDASASAGLLKKAVAEHSAEEELQENDDELQAARSLSNAESAARAAWRRRAIARKLKQETERKLARDEAKIRARVAARSMEEIRETVERVKRQEARDVAAQLKALEEKARKREKELDEGANRADKEAEAMKHSEEARRLEEQARKEAQFASSIEPADATGATGTSGRASA